MSLTSIFRLLCISSHRVGFFVTLAIVHFLNCFGFLDFSFGESRKLFSFSRNFLDFVAFVGPLVIGLISTKEAGVFLAFRGIMEVLAGWLMIKCEEKENEENLGETRYVDDMSTHARCITSY